MEVLLSITLFVFVAGAFVGGNLLLGRLVRPKLPHPEKARAYECGEEAFGPGWVQFDLRFYIVALVYLVFAVEVALFYPWAVAYGSADRDGATGAPVTADAVFAFRGLALVDMLFFFALLGVGFAYLWRFGYLDWVHGAERRRFSKPAVVPPPRRVAPTDRPAGSVARPVFPLP